MRPRGAAMQCRITTEDPANGFRPDTGRITGYRSPGGAGIRLDGGTHLGAEIGAHFDSMLVKLTCRGRDFPTAVARARRALAEFRIRGVSTNIPFLQAVLDDPDFRAGRVTTSFIDERPHLLTARTPADRGTKILNYLADVTVNQPHGPRPSKVYPQDKLPADRPVDATAAGARRQRLIGAGTGGFRAVDAGVSRPWASPTPRSGTRISRCWRPGCAPPGCWGGALCRQDDAGAAVHRVLGRRDLRCGAAVSERGPVGAAGRAA